MNYLEWIRRTPHRNAQSVAASASVRPLSLFKSPEKSPHDVLHLSLRVPFSQSAPPFRLELSLLLPALLPVQLFRHPFPLLSAIPRFA